MRIPNTLRGGFTLVELLVVIGIIATLIAILLPTLSKARDAATNIKCLARIRSLASSAQMYSNENRGYFPPVAESTDSSGTYNGGNSSKKTVFPMWISLSAVETVGDRSYLAKYLNRTALDMYICAAQQQIVMDQGMTPNSYDWISYKYSQTLGGDDVTGGNWTTGAPHLIPTATAGSFEIRPWKYSQVRNASNTALFVDGNYKHTSSRQRNTFTFAGYGSNVQAINEQATTFLHFQKLPGGTYQRQGVFTEIRRIGMCNMSFVDGSARSVQTSFTKHPAVAYEDVIIDPYHDSSTW